MNKKNNENTSNDIKKLNEEDIKRRMKKISERSHYGMKVDEKSSPKLAEDERLKSILKSLANPKPVKVFISQPMSGLSDTVVMKKRIEVFGKFVQYMYDKGNTQCITLIDNFLTQSPNCDADANTHITYLSHDIGCLAYADYIVMVEGWDNARGCRIEHEIAKEYGIKIYYEVSATDDDVVDTRPDFVLRSTTGCEGCKHTGKCPPHDCPHQSGSDVCCKTLDEEEVLGIMFDFYEDDDGDK